MRATWGSNLYSDHVANVDELPIARLRDAGAIILGKTNCPEFTLQGYTDNLIFGPTRNPWNLELTPGGSSGGAVAAVSAGIGPIAIGTDGGGSIRRPASHTGLVGLKPSRGRVPRSDGFPAILLQLETLGPMARTVADLCSAMQIITPPDPRDPSSFYFRKEPFEVEPIRPTRILYVPQFADSPVDPEVRTKCDRRRANLCGIGSFGRRRQSAVRDRTACPGLGRGRPGRISMVTGIETRMAGKKSPQLLRRWPRTAKPERAGNTLPL